VLPPPANSIDLRMNQADMEQAAHESRGKFYSLADADSLLDVAKARRRESASASE